MVALTYKKAKDLLSVGDAVYTVENGVVIEHTIERIFSDSLKVKDGYLYFDDIRQSWWMTKACAAASIGRTKKIVTYI